MKQVPMKQILLVVGTLLWWLTAGGLLPPTSYAASPPASHTRISSGLGWGALPYFNLSQSERFYVTTNRTWTGAREVQADAFNGYVASQYANWAGPKGERVAAIWSPRCTRRAQHIVLTRTVLLPGIPSQLYVKLVARFTSAVYSRLISSVALLVNGYVAAKLTRQPLSTSLYGERLRGRIRRYFVFGSNRLELRIVRQALPGEVPNCGGEGTGASTAFVEMELYGQFDALLTATAATPLARTTQVRSTFDLLDHGPSAAIAETFVLTLSFDEDNRLLLETLQITGATCISTQSSPRAYLVSCPLPNVRSAHHGTIEVSFPWNVDPHKEAPYTEHVRWTWTIGGFTTLGSAGGVTTALCVGYATGAVCP